MRVLIGCECSGVVRRAFRARGHDAWSCDLKPARDGSPWHIQGDLLAVLGQGWDLFICHPPCTFLCGSAAWAFKDPPYHQKVKAGTLTGAARREARDEAGAFALALWRADVGKVALENPRGFLPRYLGPATQTVQPFNFGDDASKGTCLWLRGLPPLVGTRYVEPRLVDGKRRWSNQTDSGQNKLSPSDDRAERRAVTFLGIAEAMAENWG